MGSPVSVVVAKIVMQHIEKRALATFRGYYNDYNFLKSDWLIQHCCGLSDRPGL